MSLEFQHVAVIGAGAMGRGIAQIAAQAGSQVWLLDTQAGAAQQACEALGAQWEKLQAKGKCSAEQVQQWRAALHVAGSVSDLANADLIVEAVVERLDVKQALFAQLEEVASPQAVLVSNTSSLSIAAIAANLRQPGRVAGYHFFNPVPLMRVVEVVASVRTDAEVVERLVRYAQAMGHQAVVAQDTPGFIVNHAGRGYGTEALRLLGEGVCDVATADRILRDQAGFRLGPFELFDLTGLDVSHPVMESIYQQYYAEPRYRPSVITAQRLAAGLVGRKKGQGFYRYVDNQPQPVAEAAAPSVPDLPPVWVSPKAARRAELLQWLKDQQLAIETGAVASSKALIVVAPLGFDVTTLAAVEGLDASRTVGIDLLLPDAATKRRVVATNPATRQDMRQGRPCPVCPRRQTGEHDSRQRRLCHATGAGRRGKHCLGHLPARHMLAGRFGLGRFARLGLPQRAAGMGRRLRPKQRAGDFVQHANRVRRPTLPPQPLAAAARRPGLELAAHRGLMP